MRSGESVPLHDFCRIVQGGRLGLSSNDFVPSGFPAYGAGGVNGCLATHEFDEPAVVLSAIGARCGKCFFADGKWTSLANTQLIFPDPVRADCKFLWYQLNDERRWHRSGTGQPFIKPSDVKAHRVFLPPLPEQRRIAEILDKADALRAKRRAALAQLDTLNQSIFLDMFGDPISNPRKWPQENLATFFYFRTGKLDSNAAVASGQYPFFTCSREDFRIDTFAFDCEALLLAGNNASADYSVKHYKGKFNAYQRTYVITLRDERNSYDYARFVLEHRLGELKRMSKGTGTKYLTMELLNRIRVPVPRVALQHEFARRATAVEALKTSQRVALAEQDALFATLQHRAFRGEL